MNVKKNIIFVLTHEYQYQVDGYEIINAFTHRFILDAFVKKKYPEYVKDKDGDYIKNKSKIKFSEAEYLYVHEVELI